MHCESNGCRSGRKPCPTPRQCGAYSYADGGNYHPEYAENTYLHLREPAATAQVKPYIAPQDEPMSELFAAIVKGFCVLFVLTAVGYAAASIFY